jgi:hypothetical protein
MSASEAGTPSGPYAQAALIYWQAGWRGCLPLPTGQKAPVPNGWTGRDGAWPSFADIYAWVESRGAGNLGLRLPPGVLGIDVDQYGNKPGYLVLQSLEQQLGALPATWRSTSRDDGMSGIRLYRIPEGLRWPGVLGPGIETIRFEHRYAVAWPSVHPNGGTYRWITPQGATALEAVPVIDDLPRLPAAWVDHFTHGELATDQARADLTDGAAGVWVAERGTGAVCRHMASALTSAQADLTSASSRHDATLSATNRLTWLAGEGHTGGTEALGQLRATFLKATAGDRAAGDAEAEWDRMVSGAVRLAAAAHPTITTDPCEDPFAGLIPKDSPWLTTAPTTSTASTPAMSATAAASSAASTTTSPAAVATVAGTSTAPGPTTVAPSAEGQASATATATSAVASSAPSTATTADGQASASADDLTELQLRRNQAAASEVERLRAQRQAQRILEREDEDGAVADRVRRRLLDDKAAIEYKRQTEPPSPPFDAGTLADVLARPAEPPMRVDGLIPWSGSALVVAQRKTGKTTLLLNYARALITGERFLGEFDVIPLPPEGRVAFLNYEVSAAQLARWADEAGIPADRRNPLGHPDDRAALAATLRAQNVQAVIVDPFGRAYTGVSQNDNGEVQAFLVGLEEFVRSGVGALDLMLATHAGWDGERTRGASALEDWGDVIVTLTRDADDESRRFMRAMGRDVDVEEDELVMDEGRTLTRTGNGSRRGQKSGQNAARLAVYVVRAARDIPGCSKARMAAAIREMDDAPALSKSSKSDAELKAAIAHAEKHGFLRVDRGGNGRPDNHFAVTPEETTATTAQPPQAVDHRTTATAVYEAVVVGGGSEGGLSTKDVGGGLQSVKDDDYAYDPASGMLVNRRTGETA